MTPAFARRGIAFIGLITAMLPAACATDWPGTWKNAYDRFERYLAMSSEAFPETGLELEEDGIVRSSAFAEPEETTLWIYEAGMSVWGMRPEGPIRPQAGTFGFLPGVHAAGIATSGKAGKKQLRPLVWFDVHARGSRKNTIYTGKEFHVEALPPPDPPESRWPNERLLAWLDFQSLPKRHPDAIRKANEKVSPSAPLSVDPRGVIHRDRFPNAAFEHPLVWRIYCNGVLVDQSSATNATRLETAAHGPGNYIALLGIEGSGGFFPISNLLSFHLVPGEAGHLELAFRSSGSAEPSRWFYDLVLPAGSPKRWNDPAALALARTLAGVRPALVDNANEPDAPWIRKTAED